MIPWLEARLQSLGMLRPLLEKGSPVQMPVPESLRNHIVVIGYGRVGKHLVDVLSLARDCSPNHTATANNVGVLTFSAGVMDVNTIYAVFNNHWTGDYKPYVLKSADLGRSWTSITANLPARGSTWTIAEDPRNRNPT
jgi:hypothetical protein